MNIKIKKIEIDKIEIKKKDWILIIMILLVALSAFIMHHALQKTGSGQVVVKINGAIEGTYDLNDDRKILINDGSNVLVIKNGKADMIEADCPDKLCVEQRTISKNNESIICLPNEVVVEIKSTSESQLDGMTN